MKSVRFDQLEVNERFKIFPNSKAMVYTKRPTNEDNGNNVVDEGNQEFKFSDNLVVYSNKGE